MTEPRNAGEYMISLTKKLKENGLGGVDCIINNAGVVAAEWLSRQSNLV